MGQYHSFSINSFLSARWTTTKNLLKFTFCYKLDTVCYGVFSPTQSDIFSTHKKTISQNLTYDFSYYFHLIISQYVRQTNNNKNSHRKPPKKHTPKNNKISYFSRTIS